MIGTWGGAVAIWNDITSEGRENFYEWHGREHIPERVSIPGFLGGRRYVARYGAPEYFTLYPTASADAFRSDEYARRLNAPTPWTLRSTAEFRNVARALCEVDCSVGALAGGLLATWRLDFDDQHLATRKPALAETVRGLSRSPGVAGAYLLVTDMAASRVDNEERKRRGEPNTVPRCIVLVESWGDEGTFKEQCSTLTRDLAAGGGVADVAHGLYVLQTLMTDNDLRPTGASA